MELLLVTIVAFHLILAPYTKVEESFNMQAIHDILNHGVYPTLALENYDHNSFPGVVPRTFLGSLAIAGVVKAIDSVYSLLTGSSFITDGLHGQLHVQLIVRAILGVANVLGLISIRKAVDSIAFSERKTKQKGLVGFAFIFLLLSQFHILFYATRTLPNFVVLPLVNYALSKLIVGDTSGLTWLAFAGTVFRLEVGIFATTIAVVSSLVFGQSNLFHNVFMLAAGSIVGLVATYTVDSYFWGYSVLPELLAFVFNVIAGNSAAWGTEPYFSYFTKYITNFFRPPHVLILAVLGLRSDPADDGTPMKLTEDKRLIVTHPARNSLRVLAVSAILFVATMSFQPHKEWRFIVYVIPVFTLLAANGFAGLWLKKSRLIAHKLLIVLMFTSTVVSFALSTYMAYASCYNYPGGGAIEYVNRRVEEKALQGKVVVHMDVPACMTGVTKFTELHSDNIVYDKTEDEKELAKVWNNVTYLITHKDFRKPLALDFLVYDASHWDELILVPAFAGVNAIGFVLSAQKLLTDVDFRASLASAVWEEMKEGRFATLERFVRSSIILRDYLRVYERIQPDVMPVFLEKGEIVEDQPKSKPDSPQITVDVELEHQNAIADLKSIDADEVRDAVNEEIDQLEGVNEHHVVTEDDPEDV